MWISTHSPRLITAAPLDAIVHIVPASGNNANQLTRASDEADRMRLLEDLGVHPIEAFQSDALVIVEGATDAQRLSALLPLELGRTAVLVAGTAINVEAVVGMLNEGDIPIPHLGIRDRDYLSLDEIEALEAKEANLFIWRSRSIENEILYPPLIAKTLERVGREATEADIRARLREVADGQREAVHSELVEATLRRAHAYEKAGETPLARQRHHLEEVRRVASEKLDAFQEVSERVGRELDEQWQDDFLTLADGKRLFGEFLEFTGFRSVRDFLAALTQTAHDHPDLLPPGFVALRERLEQLLPPRLNEG